MENTKCTANYSENILSDEIIAYISKSLPRYTWVYLAHSLGFLSSSIAFFNQKASSSENHYSQCQLMLTNWRSFTEQNEIIPRLYSAFIKIRRKDLAAKLTSDVSRRLNEQNKKDVGRNKNQKNQILTTRTNHIQIWNKNDTVSGDERGSKRMFPDNKIESLARKLLNNKDWEQLAYALGLLPEDVSHIIGKASSGQNLFAQAILMLKIWRSRTHSSLLNKKLQEAFVRIRRYDLLHLQRKYYFVTVE